MFDKLKTMLNSGAAAAPVDKNSGFGFKGSAAIVQVGGYIASDAALEKLIKGDKYVAYEKLLHDLPILAAALRLFMSLVAKSTWQIEPPADLPDDQKARAEEIAEVYRSIMADTETPWPRIVRRIAMYVFYGFSVHEWAAVKRSDGYIGIADIRVRPQSSINRWELDTEGRVLGVWQLQPDGKEVLIPRSKIIYAVDDTMTTSPEGTGLVRHLVRSAARLRAYEVVEEVAYENDLRGIPVARAPLNEMQQRVDDGSKPQGWLEFLVEPLRAFITGQIRNEKTGLVLDSAVYRDESDEKSPSGAQKWGVDLLRGDAQGLADVASVVQRITTEIAIVLGVEHLLLGKDGGGSLALSKDKSGTFYMTLTGALYELVAILEDDWRDPIAEMNGFPKELLPTLAVEEIRNEDIEQITTALRNMAQAGVMIMPGDPCVSELFGMMGLTPPPDPDLVDELLDSTGDDELPVPDPEEIEKSLKKWIRRRR